MRKIKILFISLAVIILAVTISVMTLSAINKNKSEKWLSKPQAPGRMISVGSQRIYYTVMGSGSPAVIIQCGLGSSSPEWWHIQKELSRFATVITYDRPGYGWSGYSRESRTATAVNKELGKLLSLLNIKGPYVLVGHDIGALYMQQFAATHKWSIRGILFIEPYTTDFFRLKKEIKGDIYNNLIDPYPVFKIASFLAKTGILRVSGAVPYLRLDDSIRPLVRENYCREDLYATVFQEYRKDLKTSIEETKRAGSLPVAPLIVVRHNGKAYRKELMQYALSYDEAMKVEEIMTGLYRGAASLSPKGRIIETSTAGFDIHIDEPAQIIKPVLKLLGKKK